MSKLAALQRELAEARENVQVCDDMLALDPGDADALETKPMQEALIADLTAQITAETAKRDAASAAAPPPPPPADNAAPPPPPSKYDMSKHPKFRQPAEAAPPPPTPTEEQSFAVKDTVLAKWSQDKQWYPATIISKTGSAADPVYTVTFKTYNNTETKRKHEIRPAQNNNTESKKRKAEDMWTEAFNAPVEPPSPNAGRSSRAIISAAPTVDPSLVQQQAKREPSKVSDGPTRMAPEPKKLKGQKQLQKNQSNWQAWTASGPKKGGAVGRGGGVPGAKKKESQFRTPDLPGAKVGFTGSGKGMQKEPARQKWDFRGGAYEDRARGED